MANSNLGNGNLRPETFGTISQELPLRIAGPPTETDPWRGKLRKCRAILWRRKSRRFARTTWWSGGDSNRWPSRFSGRESRDFASDSQRRSEADPTAEGDVALTLQRPLPDGALMIVLRGDRTGDPLAQPFPEPRGASPRPPLLRLPPQMLTEFWSLPLPLA